MTDQEWLTCAARRPILDFLGGKTSDRKLRLFACACCRRVSHLFTSRRSGALLEQAEKYADEPPSKGQLLRAFRAAQADDPAPKSADHAAVHGLDPSALRAAYQVAYDATIHKAGGVQFCRIGGSFPKPPGWRSFEVRKPTVHALEEATQANLLRCLIGSRVQRPVALDRFWLTSEAKELAEAIYETRDLDGLPILAAEAIYETRDFDGLPILADALEEAGYDDSEILGHCRGAGSYARGCWVIDLLLDKK